MELSQISESLQRDAVWVVFLNVLLQQAGLPVPAVPTLLLAGSLAVSGLVGTAFVVLLLLAGYGLKIAEISDLVQRTLNKGSR